MKHLSLSAPPSSRNSRRIHSPALPTSKRIIRRLLVLFALLVLSGGTVLSQPSTNPAQPTDGPFAYHQLRPGSGLGGSGFGVDAQGRLSLSGPIAFSTPVANTLGHNRFVIGGSQYSFSSKPVFNTDQANWSAFAMYGNTIGRSVNVALTANIVDVQEDVVFNFQMQYIPPKNGRLALSAGLADITDPGTSKTIDYGGFRTSSFSPFAVATYRVNPGRYTTHLTAGTGMRRFAPFFWFHHGAAGASAALLDRTGSLREQSWPALYHEIWKRGAGCSLLRRVWRRKWQVHPFPDQHLLLNHFL